MNEKYEVYNPNNKLVEELSVIYGFSSGGKQGDMIGQLIAEDGTGLGSHLCSNEGYMLGDLGILKGTRKDRHETFKKHYPEGYRMDFVTSEDVENHKELNKAFILNKESKPKPEGSYSSVEITAKEDLIECPCNEQDCEGKKGVANEINHIEDCPCGECHKHYGKLT